MEAEYQKSETFRDASSTKERERIAKRLEVLALRQQAGRVFNATKSEAIRVLARERGGINDRTREAIFAEATQAGRAAAEAVYLANGYTRCSDPQGFDCQRLASPGYGSCPFCTLKD